MNTCVPVTRETIGWRAMPKREYRCIHCGENYEHDEAYGHNIEKCQRKERANKAKGA